MLKKILKYFTPNPKLSQTDYYCPHCFEHIGANEHGKRRLPKHINVCSFNPDNIFERPLDTN